MAQNIEIANAQYNDVPSIEVPLQGGGTASFVDTSDADAVASEIDIGKTAYVNGVKLTGTRSGGGGSNTVAIPDPVFSSLVYNVTSSWDTSSTTDYTYTAVKPCYIIGMVANGAGSGSPVGSTENDGVLVLINNEYVGNVAYTNTNASITAPVIYALDTGDVIAFRRQTGNLKMYVRVCDIKEVTSPSNLTIAVPDLTNLVATIAEDTDSWSTSADYTYTATQDCVVCGMVSCYGSNTPSSTVGVGFTINGEYLYNVHYSATNANATFPINIPLAQGDVLEVKRLTGYVRTYLHAYALR